MACEEEKQLQRKQMCQFFSLVEEPVGNVSSREIDWRCSFV